MIVEKIFVVVTFCSKSKPDTLRSLTQTRHYTVSSQTRSYIPCTTPPHVADSVVLLILYTSPIYLQYIHNNTKTKKIVITKLMSSLFSKIHRTCTYTEHYIFLRVRQKPYILLFYILLFFFVSNVAVFIMGLLLTLLCGLLEIYIYFFLHRNIYKQNGKQKKIVGTLHNKHVLCHFMLFRFHLASP